MRFFQNASIRLKQMLIIMLTSTITLLLACAGFIGVDAFRFRRELSEQISTMAQIAGNNCAAALEFQDPRTAKDTLGAFQQEPTIANACVYNVRGEVFATYQRDGQSPAAGFPPLQPEGHEFRGHQLHLFAPITNRGEQVGTIYITYDLDELDTQMKHVAEITLIVLVISLLAAFFLSLRLQRVISDPILRLAQMARSVALDKNYSVRGAKQSNDELGQLVDGFNEMLVQIQARDAALEAARISREKSAGERIQEMEIIHKQLVEASRRGGMAEIATNVLHNVGNVLNSVNVSATLVMDALKQSKTARLAKVVALLREHEHDLAAFITSDPQGKQLPAYLAELSEHLVADQETTVRELELLRGNIEHIKEIVAMQQSHAKVAGVKELINVCDVVEDSLRMNISSLNRHDVQVVREFEKVPLMYLDRHRILQILVNLLRNAKHACRETDRADKRLTLRVTNGDGRLKISVIDNGVGISPENLTRIFNHGFTTRKGGHGFGLHGGAIAAKEMDGSLTVLSEGLGRGAAFTLELPYESPDRELSAPREESA